MHQEAVEEISKWYGAVHSWVSGSLPFVFCFFKEFSMPSPIPVQIGQQQFSSMNKARLHYRDMLYKHERNTPVKESDRQQVIELVTSATSDGSPRSFIREVRVITGCYGRPCFEVRTENDGKHAVSIMKAIRESVVTPSAAHHTSSAGT